MREGLTLEELKSSYDKTLAPGISNTLEVYDKRYNGFKAKFSMISAGRSVGVFK
jgi:hypothetical protein